MVCFVSTLTPVFDGSNYVVWSCRIEVYLFSLGYDIWMLVINGLSRSDSSPTDLEAKRRSKCNVEAMNSILSGLPSDVSS